MNRDEITELAAGYALGALDSDDRTRFEALLAAGDGEATAALRDFEGTVAGIAAETIAVPSPTVKAALMARIDAQGRSPEAVPRRLSSVKPSPSGRSAWTLVLSGAMAAGIAAIAVGWVVSSAYDRRVTRLAQETTALKQELERQQSLIALLQDPATQVVALAGLEAAPGARARMLWHETAGGLLIAHGLPPAPDEVDALLADFYDVDGLTEQALHLLRDAYARVREAERVLGWSPSVPFKTGLQATIAYFESLVAEGKLERAASFEPSQARAFQCPPDRAGTTAAGCSSGCG